MVPTYAIHKPAKEEKKKERKKKKRKKNKEEEKKEEKEEKGEEEKEDTSCLHSRPHSPCTQLQCTAHSSPSNSF